MYESKLLTDLLSPERQLTNSRDRQFKKPLNYHSEFVSNVGFVVFSNGGPRFFTPLEVFTAHT